MQQKKIIVVLGAHRSGTSLCTHAIEVLGAYTGIETLHTSHENEKGFFEHREIILFNEKLLAALGGSWDNPAFDAQDALRHTDVSAFHSEAIALMSSLFGDAECIVLKDPRLCQLLPFWQAVFPALGFTQQNTFYVHVLRHPAEVARSQQKRVEMNPAYYEFGREIAEGAALWFSLTGQSLQHTRGQKNFLLTYESLLENTEATLKKLSQFLSLAPSEEELQDFCSSFVDNTLRRSIAATDSIENITHHLPQAIDLFNALVDISSRHVFSEEDILPCLRIIQNDDARHAILETLPPALSRLSNQNRRLHAYPPPPVASPIQTKCNKLCARLHKCLMLAKRNAAALYAKIHVPPFQHWLRLRKHLVQLNIWLRRHFPTASKYIRHYAMPVVRSFDRLILRLSQHQHATVYDITNIEYRYQQADMPVNRQPLVTVIVPNYNHAPYLKKRLDSIYNQSYQNFEVILMDDCSKDDSVEILKSYSDKYPDNTQLILNTENSGGVFYQWEKGIKLAKGEIIWIAESDDYCTENFLETLVPMFRNEAVMLAYARTEFVRGSNEDSFWTLNEYLHDIDAELWNTPFALTAPQIVERAFAIKNIIPNVSSALFRKVDKLEILYDAEWKKMRTCGDWVLYLHILRGGMLAYSPAATNYYRIHDKNTSVSSYTQDSFYQEHEFVARTLLHYYSTPVSILQKLQAQLEEHWQRSRDDYSVERFKACFNIERAQGETPERALNLLMGGYAFCAGGGETFPIQLANIMKKHGYNITFLDCNQVPRLQEIRESLRSDIPVVSNLATINLIIKDFNIDLIHSHHAWLDNCILELRPANCKAKTIVTIHGMYEMLDAEDAQYIIPRLYKKTAHIVYTAEKNLQALQTYNNGDDMQKVTRIDNALDIYAFTPLPRQELNIPDEAFVLTLVSRAVEDKGWLEAVEAVEKARARTGHDIHLILIGEGAVYDALKQKTLPDYIHLEGFQKDIRAYFASSDMGFLPSRFPGESFPLVLIDCLHAGTPMLASSVGEIPYMLSTPEGDAGIVFDLQDDWSINIEELAQIIADTATHPEILSQLQERVALAAKKFDPSVMATAYNTVYKRALENS